jgi:uncharacterized protein YjbJ (UPF0337 family)
MKTGIIPDVNADWNILKGKLKQRYAILTDRDLLFEEGAEEEMYGRLQKILGKTKEQIINSVNNRSHTF